jgi:hypothetical protein
MVTFGISFKFPPDGRGRAAGWQGIYAGGHGGGAWGDRTNASYSASETLIAGSDVRLKRKRYAGADHRAASDAELTLQRRVYLTAGLAPGDGALLGSAE